MSNNVGMTPKSGGGYVGANVQKGHVARLSDPFVICDGCGQRFVAPIDHVCNSKEGYK
jgi:glycyl-tRNA synthetase (class II)